MSQSKERTWRSTAFVAALAHIMIAMLAVTQVDAGDDVDYSAPYMTLENGELVTKYPDIEHSDNQPATGSQEDRTEPKVPTIAKVAIASMVFIAALATLLYLRRRRVSARG